MTHYMNRRAARVMMINLLNNGDYIDCGEVQCTQLAEYVAHDLNHSEWLDDETHWIWDLAVDLAARYE
jgi:hypothetical protein